jgi:PhnB protein
VRLIPYLVFNGQCEEAFKFYAECLGGKIEAMMPHRGTPVEQHVSSDWQDKILHARLNTGEGVLMGSDAPPGRYEEPKGFSIDGVILVDARGLRFFVAGAVAAGLSAIMLPGSACRGIGRRVDRRKVRQGRARWRCRRRRRT